MPVATPGKVLVKPLGVFCILLGCLVLRAEAQTPQSDIPIKVFSAQAGAILELRFGLDPSATDGLDPGLGEQLVPPLPPGDGFAAQFVGSDIGVAMAPQQKDYRRGSLSTGGTRVHELQFQTSDTDIITIAWNLPAGVTGRLNDILTGTARNISMKGTGNYIETFPAVFNKFRLTVIYAAPAMGTPALQTPTNGAINVPLGARLRWHPTPGAESYRVQIAYSARFDSLALDKSGIVDTSLQVVLVNPETIYYWHVRAQDDTLSGGWSSPAWTFRTGLSQNVRDVPSGLPQEIVLEQNFPNPFNPSTTIRYSLPGQARVTLKIYNALGQCLACLVDATQEAGSHEVTFGGASLPSGICFYRLQAGEYTCTKRLLILR